MSRLIIKKGIPAAIGMCMIAGSAFADAPAAKWYDTIGLSGYLQGSYVGNFENSSKNPNNQGRQFDTNGNTFSLNSFLLQIAKPVGDSDHYGFTVRLRTGSDATVLPAVTGTGAATEVAIQEAYVTYAVPSLTKLQLIAGRFVTPEGFEGVDTVNNPNFSEGLLFTFAEPINHTGIKANYTFNDKVNATLGVVNGWNVNTDNNTQKTILWQVATTPTKQITWSFQGLYGNEQTQPKGLAASDHADTLSLDTVAGYNPTDKLSLNVQGNWGQQTNDPNTPKGTGTSHWDGLGIWVSYATTSKMTESARFEVMQDQNNANRFGAATFANGTTNQTVKEFTLTHKTMLTSALGTRLEYRHDWSNQAYFVRSDGSSVRNQNTISMDWFVMF